MKPLSAMGRTKAHLYRRGIWYLAGLVLFYAPFAYYEKGLNWLLNSDAAAGIHQTCFRIPIQNFADGKGLAILTVGGISTLLLVTAAFFLGPFFCGRLCASGALPEYLSRLLPKKWKVDLYEHVNPVPIRYGFLIGFVVSPFLAGSIACAFCNYSFLERLTTGSISGDIGVLGSTAIITAFLWLVPFGILAQGGRGYCSFMCPVGAVQSAFHSVGRRFGFTYKLRMDQSRCVSCSSCVGACPMGALSKEDGAIAYQVHNCITCRQCVAACPKGALEYGRGEHGWAVDRKAPEPVVAMAREQGL